MNPKPKILIASTSAGECTGYARVSWHIVNGLAARGWDVVHFGFQRIMPESGRAYDERVTVIDVGQMMGDRMSFGESAFPQIVKAVDPDIVMIYNDCLVITSFLQQLRDAGVTPKKLVIYLDLVHDCQIASLIEPIMNASDMVLVFTPHWKRSLEMRYGHATPIVVVPHGIDGFVSPVDQREARQRLGIPLKGFLIVNSNRNSYRKALDVTIRVFLEVLAKSDGDVFLFLNCNSQSDSGFDFVDIITHECRRVGLDSARVLDHHVLRFQNSGFVSDDVVNLLHNASDVGINTCVGEGFGLCNAEAALLNKPQLVTKTGGLGDLFGDTAIRPIERLALCRGFIPHGGYMDVPDSAEFVRRASFLYLKWKKRGPASLRTEPPFDPATYRWTPILDALNATLVDAVVVAVDAVDAVVGVDGVDAVDAVDVDATNPKKP